MEEKKLKINIPEGYEIDKEKSTFEEIIFKKIEDPLAKLPKTWEEYCKQTIGCKSYFHSSYLKPYIKESLFDGVYCEFSTEERVKQYVALGKLLQLRDYWVSNWKDDSNNFVKQNFLKNFVAVIYHFDGEIVNTNVSKKRSSNYSLTFPTREIAQKFIECFKDLINEAYPLI